MIDEKIVTVRSSPENRTLLLPKDVFWTAAGLLLELGTSPFSSAPSGVALAAGLSGRRAICVVLGGIAGTLLHGFPNAFTGLVALALVFAMGFIPEFRNAKLRAAVRSTQSGITILVTRLGEASGTTQLLHIILSAIAAAVFTLCVYLLSENIRCRGFDISDAGDCTLVCIISVLVFASLGALDYSAVNVGRVVLGFLLLVISSSRGYGMCAAVGISGILGLSANSPEIGAGGAVFAFAAASAVVLARYHRIVRALGYVFIAVTAALIMGVDEGSWRLLAEAAVSGAAFAVLPYRGLVTHGGMRISGGESEDISVMNMLKERLNFAADAISAIETGIQSAAETLDRKYKATIEDVPERAADRCCRSCPNSMVCWGKHYEMFCAEFSRLTDVLRADCADIGELALSAECAEICLNPDGVIDAVSAEYSRYVSVKTGERRVRELRRIYTDQLVGLRDILRDMGGSKGEISNGSRYQAAERRAEKILRSSGMELPQAFVMFDNRGKLRFEAYAATEPKVTIDYLGVLLSRTLGRELDSPMLSGGGGRYKLTAAERPLFSAKVGAYQIPRGQNKVCGDCYEYFTNGAGVMYIILSDGMGSGSRARVDSTMACSVLSKLLKSGMSMTTALEVANTSLMVKSADESFATLDICQIDLNSGEGAVYKAGAATTYIKSKDRLMRASLSSAPIGSGGRTSVPVQKFTVSAGDVVIMMTDGVVTDELWLSRELSQRVDPDRLSEQIAKAARIDKSRDDDISVITLLVGQ